MGRLGHLYKVKDVYGKIIRENLTNAEAAEVIGCRKTNIWPAANCAALVNKKYRIEFQDTLLSRNKDKKLLQEWDRYRIWFLKAMKT